MSNLGFQAVLRMLNRSGRVVAERLFWPDPALLEEHRRTRTPLLSLETQRPASEFEAIAFSVSHESDYPKVPAMLEMAGLAPRAADRRPSDPLILAGGVTVRTNPEPLAPFMDLMLVGDGEIVLPELVRTLGQARSSPLPNKPERLLDLVRQVPGAYAPGLYEAAFDSEGRLVDFHPTHPDAPAVLSVPRTPLPRPIPVSAILTPDTEFADTRLIEIGRGCPGGCRFCLAGFVYRPPRFQPADDLIAELNRFGPDDRVGLVSPAVGDHPRLEYLVRALVDQGRQVTVSSLRLEALTAGLVDALYAGRMKSGAVAPEAGSERLRRAINKNLSRDQIMTGVDLLAESGLARLRLYFMLGLPTETPEEALEIADLTLAVRDRLLERLKKKKRLPQMTVSLMSFIPKPATPFQDRPMLEPNQLARRAKAIRARLAPQGIRFHFDPPKWAYLQTLFSQGDRRSAEVIERLGGGRAPAQALKNLDFDPDRFTVRARDAQSIRPWDFLDHGLAPDYLDSEWRRAVAGRSTPLCAVDVCRRCGLCSPEGKT
jgi:radical SAM superfamily enzyme YgiQ (UPF0313 family)